MIHFWLSLVGVGACVLLFSRLAFLRPAETAVPAKISVVIPARNEAGSIAALLQDLQQQTLPVQEILCVDDASTDDTAGIAAAGGARVLRLQDKPTGWLGKSYACQKGADATAGGLLLFLDADVRLAPTAVEALVAAFQREEKTLSVQPRHTPGSWIEQLALFFNLVAVAALAGKKTQGLFGPVILIDRKTYTAIGGHAAVRESVVEDLSLGEELAAHGFGYRRLMGGALVRFRMYPGGLSDLYQGFVKNFALGASKTSFGFVLLVVLWIAALCRVPIEIVRHAVTGDTMLLLCFVGVYLLLVSTLYWAACKIGRFQPLALVAYPLPLLFFTVVFLVSIYKKLAHRPVVWKGRVVSGGDK